MTAQTETTPMTVDDQHAEVSRPKVLRPIPYAIDAARIDALKKAFGEDVEVVNLPDFVFDKRDPVTDVLELVGRFDNVVAVELIGPQEALAAFSAAKLSFGGVVFLKALFVQGHKGRPTSLGRSSVTGEDRLLFDHYVVLEEVVYKTSPLNPIG